VTERFAAPKQARSQAKLDRLLLAGRELFETRGYDGTRIGDVVERAGTSVGVFYSRFSDKDGFLAAVRNHFFLEVAAETAELNARAAELGGVELIRAYITQGVRIFRHNAGLIRALVYYEATHLGAEQPMRDLVEARARGLAAAVIAAGTKIGHRDPETAVMVGAHVVRGALMQEAIHGPGLLPLDDDELIDELTGLFAAYLRITPPNGGKAAGRARPARSPRRAAR
jgi:AcrR family transcriptional regulator